MLLLFSQAPFVSILLLIYIKICENVKNSEMRQLRQDMDKFCATVTQDEIDQRKEKAECDKGQSRKYFVKVLNQMVPRKRSNWCSPMLKVCFMTSSRTFSIDDTSPKDMYRRTRY